MTSKRLDALARSELDPLDARAARATALDALARRDHAAADLHRKLLDKGYDAQLVGAVIERLWAEKLLDDRRYVGSFIDYHAARGHGPIRVRADLRKIGLPDDLIEEGVEGYGEWDARLREARQKKFGAVLPTHYADRQRQSRFLSYRGFTSAQIRIAIGIDSDIDVDTQI